MRFSSSADSDRVVLPTLAMIVGCLWTACNAIAAPEGPPAADDVISVPQSAADPLEVPLPGKAGLQLLEAAGAIRKPTAEEVAAWNEGESRPYRNNLWPDYLTRRVFDYAITRQITLPPDLHRVPTKRFLLLPGVPEPHGDPSPGCIANMNNFSISPRGFCTRIEDQSADAVERIREIGDRCRLPIALPGKIVAVAVNQPRPREEPTPEGKVVDVNVEGAGDVVLVLNNVDFLRWRITVSPDVRVTGVIVFNLRDTTVEGLDAGVPVFLMGPQLEGSGISQFPRRNCSDTDRYIALAYEGGPWGFLLDAQVKGLTGRGLDGFYGGFRIEEFDVEVPQG